MMSSAVQQAVSRMAAFTARRVLAAWKAQAVVIASERDAEAEQLCKLRIQEARKTGIASKFHRVWQLHSALKTWAAAARESASTRAAQTQAALQEAAIAARMEIASQFQNNFQLHAAMDVWRCAASSLQQERQASQQAQVVQSRIDAVLARVRAGQRDGKAPWARQAAAECIARTTHGVAKDCVRQTVSEAKTSDVQETTDRECPVGSSSHPSTRSTMHGSGCSHHATTAGEVGKEILPNPQASEHAFSVTRVDALVPTANPREVNSQWDAVMPYPEAESVLAEDYGEIRVFVRSLCMLTVAPVQGERTPFSERDMCDRESHVDALGQVEWEP